MSSLLGDDDCYEFEEIGQEEEAELLREDHDDDVHDTTEELELDYEDDFPEDLDADDDKEQSRCNKFTTERTDQPAVCASNDTTPITDTNANIHQQKFGNNKNGNNQRGGRSINGRSGYTNRAKWSGYNNRAKKPVQYVQPWLNPPINYSDQQTLNALTLPLLRGIINQSQGAALSQLNWQPPSQHEQLSSFVLRQLQAPQRRFQPPSLLDMHIPPPHFNQNNNYLPQQNQNINQNFAFGKVNQPNSGLIHLAHNARNFVPLFGSQQLRPLINPSWQKHQNLNYNLNKRPNKSIQNISITPKRKSLNDSNEHIEQDQEQKAEEHNENIKVAVYDDPTPEIVEDAELLSYRLKIEDQKRQREQFLAEKERRRKLKMESETISEVSNGPEPQSITKQSQVLNIESPDIAGDPKSTVHVVTRSDGEKIKLLTSITKLTLPTVMPIETPTPDKGGSNFLDSRKVIQSNSLLCGSKLVIVSNLINNGEPQLKVRE